ncbi:hypothetical protein BJX70DRAFT_365045 [Aspergillus crustosus]
MDFSKIKIKGLDWVTFLDSFGIQYSVFYSRLDDLCECFIIANVVVVYVISLPSDMTMIVYSCRQCTGDHVSSNGIFRDRQASYAEILLQSIRIVIVILWLLRHC